MLTQIKNHPWDSLLNSLPNTAITAMNHWVPSFLSGLILHPATTNTLTKPKLPASPSILLFTTPSLFYKLSSPSVMSVIPWPAWPYPPGSDFPLPSPKLSIWGRCPQSLPCLLILTLRILCFEYLSFIQPLSHQLDSSLWGQQGLVASGTKQAFKNVYRVCQRTSLTNIL